MMVQPRRGSVGVVVQPRIVSEEDGSRRWRRRAIK